MNPLERTLRGLGEALAEWRFRRAVRSTVTEPEIPKPTYQSPMEQPMPPSDDITRVVKYLQQRYGDGRHLSLHSSIDSDPVLSRLSPKDFTELDERFGGWNEFTVSALAERIAKYGLNRQIKRALKGGYQPRTDSSPGEDSADTPSQGEAVSSRGNRLDSTDGQYGNQPDVARVQPRDVIFQKNFAQVLANDPDEFEKLVEKSGFNGEFAIVLSHTNELRTSGPVGMYNLHRDRVKGGPFKGWRVIKFGQTGRMYFKYDINGDVLVHTGSHDKIAADNKKGKKDRGRSL